MDKAEGQKLFILAVIAVGGYYASKLIMPQPKKSLAMGAIEMKEDSPSDRTPITTPVFDEAEFANNPKASDAATSLIAYVAAYNAGEPQETLDMLNDQIKTDYGLKVYRRRTDNKLAVKDMSDTDVLVYSES